MAIFNMNARSDGIKVGHKLIKKLKLRDYTFEGRDVTPCTITGFPDWYAFDRNGTIYIITHGSGRGIWRYDPVEETYTQETEMTLPPTGRGTVNGSPYYFMHAKHYLYDPITDTVHFACDAEYINSQGSLSETRIEYKFDFATNTWTELTPIALTGMLTGCDWTINSAGTIAVGFNRGGVTSQPFPSYAPYILQGTVWTQIQNVPLYAEVRYIYNADDELCAFKPQFSTTQGYASTVYGLYIFDGSTWTQQYTPTHQISDTCARNIVADDEGNILLLAYLEDYAGTHDANMSYSTHAFAGVITKEEADALPYMSIQGIGEYAESGSLSFLQLRRAAIVWQGNTGYLMHDGTYSPSGVIKITKIKPVYESVEN